MIDIETFQSTVYLLSFILTILTSIYFYIKDIRHPKQFKTASYKVDYVRVTYGELVNIFFNILDFSMIVKTRDRDENLEHLLELCKNINFEKVNLKFFEQMKLLLRYLYKDKEINKIIDLCNLIMENIIESIYDCNRVILEKTEKNTFMSKFLKNPQLLISDIYK